jgi:glycosyltransferase involved in cell wall biosynthesis
MRTVLQVSPYYPPHLGGIELVVQHLAELLSQDHDVHVVTTTIHGDTPGPPAIPTEVTLHRHHAVELAHTVVAPGLPLSLLRAPRSAIVHVHVPHALVPEQVALATRLRGQRFLVHFHGDVGPAGSLGRLLPLYKRHLFSRVLRAAAGVIALTPDQAAFVQDVYDVPAERVFIVPNGVGPEYFRPAPARVPARETGPGDLELLFVGRLNVQKNVARLLDAMSLVHEPVHLTIVGDGDLRAQLHAQARRLGLTTGRHPRVHFAGTLHKEDLIAAYHQTDAFVLPSDHEGMPLVVLEAMASELPVVATDVTGNYELLRDIGVLTPPDPGHLARAVDRLALNPALRHELARKSRDAANAYSWNKVADQIRDIYSRVYGQTRAVTPASPIGAAG